MRPRDSERKQEIAIFNFIEEMVNVNTSRKELLSCLKEIFVSVKVSSISYKSSQDLLSDPFEVELEMSFNRTKRIIFYHLF